MLTIGNNSTHIINACQKFVTHFEMIVKHVLIITKCGKEAKYLKVFNIDTDIMAVIRLKVVYLARLNQLGYSIGNV